jgi:hypothetical protein
VRTRQTLKERADDGDGTDEEIGVDIVPLQFKRQNRFAKSLWTDCGNPLIPKSENQGLVEGVPKRKLKTLLPIRNKSKPRFVIPFVNENGQVQIGWCEPERSRQIRVRHVSLTLGGGG